MNQTQLESLLPVQLTRKMIDYDFKPKSPMYIAIKYHIVHIGKI
jgi:hypothetical protein